MIILLLVLLLVFGFGGYRMGPGIGYYGGGGLSLIVLIVLEGSRENEGLSCRARSS
jgi:hypothetical protein